MIDVISDLGVTSIIMSTEDSHALARELHDATYLDDDGSSMIYRLYDALVPTEDVE